MHNARGAAVLTLRGVTKRFGARTILNNVALALGSGEYVAIVGESGIGKSTLDASASVTWRRWALRF